MIKIENKYDCCGCLACVNRCPVGCISVVRDDEGFMYPEADASKCIGCGLCEKVCPVINPPEKMHETQIFACINKDAATRFASTSGGLFTLFAQEVIKEGGAVFGAALDDKFTVHHICVEKEEDTPLLQGSKYVQSDPGDCFKRAEKLLKSGRRVLYSGTPCQLAGLTRFLMKPYEGLMKVEVVCHGSPSPRVFELYKKAVEEKTGDLKSIRFRDKHTGWNKSCLVFEGERGTVSASKQEALYMKAFLRNMSTRPSCLPCRFNARRSSADLTICDYWGIESLYPDWNDDLGVSLAMTNTKKGEELFDKVKGQLIVRKGDYEHAAERNFALAKGSSAHPRREEFFVRLGKEPIFGLIEELV